MRHLASCACLILLSAVSGCAICPPGYLDDYATVGGKWQRSDPTRGRVGSTLSDAGSTTTTVSGTSGGAYYAPQIGDSYPHDPGYVDPNFNGTLYAPGDVSRPSVNEEYDPNVYGSADQYSTAPRYSEDINPGSTTPSGGGMSILESAIR